MDFNDILSYIPSDTNPKYSSKIYFAGNKDEFDRYFDVITKQILNITNKTNTTCTIWFRKHFDSLSKKENQLLNDFLAETHLIIVPITRNLLLKSDGVMQNEILFAKKNHKPILPIMLEMGALELYSKPENFADMQFLNPNDMDTTTIPYEKKLQDHLANVLINDKMRAKIQAAFDAYVFLSYRKKDRAQAQKLMRLIHENDFCRDVAIWYDEFLTPGEDFNKSIKDALKKSNLFTLLVTPSVIEPDNYIIKHEYPMAQQQFKENQTPILPIECVETDTSKLNDLFDNIPPCTKFDNPDLLSDVLKTSLKNIALMKNRDNPTHNYLIGLAYLNGIDVEIDYERGISLITDAANCNLPEAKKELISIYTKGIGTSIQYKTALQWTDKLIEQYKELLKSDETYGEKLTAECMDKYNLMVLMGEGVNGESALLDALNYSSYLPIIEKAQATISIYMTLADIYEKQKVAEYPLVEQFLHYEEIKAAGIPSLIKAEEVAMAHKDIPQLAPLITYLLVGIYAWYFSMGNQEKAEEYSKKVISFCKEYYPEGLDNFEEYREMDILNQKTDWKTLNGVEEYLDLYIKNIEKKNLQKSSPRELIKFVTDLSDIISYLEHTSAKAYLTKFEKYICKFIEVFEGIPLNEASSDILKIRTRLYTIAADFEKSKGNTSTVFTLMNNSRILCNEIYLRNNDETNRTLYFNISLECAKSAFDSKKADAAFYITNEVYKEWKAVCELDTSDENQIIKSKIYLNFAECFKIKNQDDDATAFFHEATKTAAMLCNRNLTAKNICCLLAAYSKFAWYKLENGDLYSAINLFNSSIESHMLFFKQINNNPMLKPSISDEEKLYYYCWNNMRGIARAYSETKQYPQEESYLRGLLEMKKYERGDLWINDHYNLAICLYCQNRLEEAAQFFEKFIELISSNITAENRYQYSFSLLKAAAFNQEKAHEYVSTAFDNLLILYNDNPNDKQVVSLLKRFLGEDFNKQEEDK